MYILFADKRKKNYWIDVTTSYQGNIREISVNPTILDLFRHIIPKAFHLRQNFLEDSMIVVNFTNRP